MKRDDEARNIEAASTLKCMQIEVGFIIRIRDVSDVVYRRYIRRWDGIGTRTSARTVHVMMPSPMSYSSI